VNDLRDYQDWHQRYDDPGSGLSWRLERVRHHIADALDRGGGQGPMSALSVCSGDGRDLLGVLAQRSDAERVSAVLMELHPGLAQQARDAVRAAGLNRVEVRTVDASTTDAYDGAAPADVVLLVGIFGNVADDDVWRLIDFAPRLCRPGATLIWSRGRHFTRDLPGVTPGDLNDEVRAKFVSAGFTEARYETHNSGSLPAIGVVRYEGPPAELPLESRPLFTFLR
jgi:SAM-dependent methyltransferase